jgi:outer membrane protein TolC
MMIPKIVRSLLVLIVVIAPAYAQSPIVQTSLSLEQCLKLARERNATLRIAKTGSRLAGLVRDEFNTTTLPRVGFRSGASYAPSSHSFGYDPVISNQGELSAQIGIEQTLYDGGVRSLRSDQLRLDIERMAIGERIADRDLVNAVKAAFIEALRIAEEAFLRRQSVRQLEDYLSIVERRVAAGSGTQTDLLKTRIQLANANVELGKSNVASHAAGWALSEVMGLDELVGIAGNFDSLGGTTAKAWNTIPCPAPEASFEARTAELEIRQMTLEAEIAGHERYPKLSVVGDAGLMTSVENLRLPKEDRYGIIGYQVGMALEVPLFNWGGTELRREERLLAADTLRYQLEMRRRSLRREAERTLLAALQAERNLDTLRANVASAEDNFLLTQSSYAGGGSLSIEVLNAQQLLTETRIAELQTRADIQLLLSRLQQLSTQ